MSVLPDVSPASIRRHRKHAEILTAAARLFSASGYHGTSLDDVAAAVGVTKPAVYHYFDSKSDILFDIYSSALSQFEDRLDEHARELPPTERLRLTVRDMLRTMAEAPTESAVLIQEGPILEACLPRRRARELRIRESKIVIYLTDTIDEGIQLGSIRSGSPQATAFAVIGMVSWASHWYRPHGRISPDALASQFTELTLNGIVLPSPS